MMKFILFKLEVGMILLLYYELIFEVLCFIVMLSYDKYIGIFWMYFGL